MNKIEEMIERLCPDGVEYKPLREVAIIKSGKDYKHLGDGDIPVYGSGGIMTYVDTAVYDKPTVLLPRKGSISNVFYLDEPFWNVDTIFYTEIDGAQIHPRFFYHVILNEHIEKLNTSNAARPALTRTVLDGIMIPVPPMEIQEEIVRVLDSFAELETKLKAELEARKAQYAYYRDKLLDFSSRGGVPLMPLGKVLSMKAGASIPTNDISEESSGLQAIPCYGGNGIRGFVSCVNQEADAVLIGRQGALCGNVQFAKAPFYATEHAVVARPNCSINLRYLYFALIVADLMQYKTAGAQPGLSVKRLERVQIPIPSLEEQERIVSILDKFDMLVNDISQGLPAEIEARRKQYEYYRDKLLTFKEKAA